MAAENQIILYGTSWCSDCHRARRLLERKNVAYQDINIETDLEARKIVEALNNGNRSVPTIIFPDESILVEPSDLELAHKLKSLGL